MTIDIGDYILRLIIGGLKSQSSLISHKQHFGKNIHLLSCILWKRLLGGSSYKIGKTNKTNTHFFREFLLCTKILDAIKDNSLHTLVGPTYLSFY